MINYPENYRHPLFNHPNPQTPFQTQQFSSIPLNVTPNLRDWEELTTFFENVNKNSLLNVLRITAAYNHTNPLIGNSHNTNPICIPRKQLQSTVKPESEYEDVLVKKIKVEAQEQPPQQAHPNPAQSVQNNKSTRRPRGSTKGKISLEIISCKYDQSFPDILYLVQQKFFDQKTAPKLFWMRREALLKIDPVLLRSYEICFYHMHL